MADNNNSKIFIWGLAVVAGVGALLWGASVLFPQIVTKLTSLLVGLFVVVTGLFLRRKR